jgi:lipopolysaccharide/colanic/teichoic acid biosynthesis glycosyltransferase
MSKRIFDLFFALLGIIFLSPLLILVSIFILLDSGWPILYIAKRIGQNEREFKMLKFRTMKPKSDKLSITVGNKDPRVTRIGYILRFLKLDELPQMINIIKGEMSFVGPRPDIAYYKEYYKKYCPNYYELKPGITSYSSIYFSNESQLYVNVEDPEKVYINETIPKKVELDKKYFFNKSIITDLKIILQTLKQVLKVN